tara:strand:+ start:258 stop:458 length:201 start_codon:yes stop_codon:yes gene_type:complete
MKEISIINILANETKGPTIMDIGINANNAKKYLSKILEPILFNKIFKNYKISSLSKMAYDNILLAF